jgi:hypothetical protein
MKRHGEVGRISASGSAVSLLYVRAPATAAASGSDSAVTVAAADPEATNGGGIVEAQAPGSGLDFPDSVGTTPRDGAPCTALQPWFRVAVTRREPVRVKGKGDMVLYWVDAVSCPYTVAVHRASAAAVMAHGDRAPTLLPPALRPCPRALSVASASATASEFRLRADAGTNVDVTRMGLLERHRASINLIVGGPRGAPAPGGGKGATEAVVPEAQVAVEGAHGAGSPLQRLARSMRALVERQHGGSVVHGSAGGAAAAASRASPPPPPAEHARGASAVGLAAPVPTRVRYGHSRSAAVAPAALGSSQSLHRTGSSLHDLAVVLDDEGVSVTPFEPDWGPAARAQGEAGAEEEGVLEGMLDEAELQTVRQPCRGRRFQDVCSVLSCV